MMVIWGTCWRIRWQMKAAQWSSPLTGILCRLIGMQRSLQMCWLKATRIKRFQSTSFWVHMSNVSNNWNDKKGSRSTVHSTTSVLGAHVQRLKQLERKKKKEAEAQYTAQPVRAPLPRLSCTLGDITLAVSHMWQTTCCQACAFTARGKGHGASERAGSASTRDIGFF